MGRIGNKAGDEPGTSVEPIEAEWAQNSSVFSQNFASSPVQEEIMQGKYIELIAAVVRSGLVQEGREYVLTGGGQYWCGLGGLDPEVVWAKTTLLAVNKRRPQPRGAAASSNL